MTKKFAGLTVSLLVASVFSVAYPAHAQRAEGSSTAPITTVVTVLGPKFTTPPAITKDDFAVYEGKEKRDIIGWVPAQGDKAALELAIVIDDANATELGIQFGDLTKFIKSQPSTCGAGIFYANNGRAQAASQFSTDHDAVAKSLRLPFGRGAAYASIYLSLMDLFSRWPVTGARREVLLIADGIDRFRGDPFSPDVTATIERAQKAGIMIHTLYASGTGRFSRNLFRVNLGQSNLAQIADATGGESFFQGTQTPIAFAPFLDEFDVILKNQYLLTFAGERTKKEKGELKSFRIRTELRNIEISAAERVLFPGP
jgi:hypothetical protein